jgi:protein SCO1/2
MKRRTLLALAPCAALGGARAQPLALPPAPQAALQQRLGARLPLDAPLHDALGQPVRLGDYFTSDQPVLLVPGYYSCTQLCGLLMHSLLQALHKSGVPRSDWRVVGVSINPADTPADAQQRRALDLAYARFLEGAHPAGSALHLDLLLADAAQARRITQAVGFDYRREPGAPGAPQTYVHPASVIVVTPAGVVSRYFNGLELGPGELRSALRAAAGGSVGSFSDRLAVLCSHFDPLVGRYSGAVMNSARAAGGLTLLGLGLAFALRRGHKERGGP